MANEDKPSGTPAETATKACPACAETIKAAAVIARLSGNGNLAMLSATDARRSYGAARRPLAWAIEEGGAVEDFERLGELLRARRHGRRRYHQ